MLTDDDSTGLCLTQGGQADATVTWDAGNSYALEAEFDVEGTA